MSNERSIASILDDVAAEAAGEAMTTETETQETEVQALPDLDDDGKEESQPGKPGDANTDEGDEEGAKAKQDDQPMAVPLAEGIQPIDGKVATQFTIQTPDGKTVVPPNVIIEYKANGRIRRERLDHVVKFAQVGVYNHEREQQIVAAQEEAQRQVDEVQQLVTLRDSQLQRLLEDPETYDKVRERYMQENVPEKRVERAQREAQALRESVQRERASQEAVQFFESNVLPELDALSDEFPEVEQEELAAQLTLATMPLTRNGVVPPSHYRQVLGIIQTDLRDWAQATHTKRTARLAGSVAKEKEAAKQAQVAAQRAKNDLGRATKPVGTVSASAPDARPARKVESVRDAVDAAMDEVLRGF